MSREFRVAEWLVEPDLNRITKTGATVSVEPKVIEVLVCLAAHAGEVLSKEKIVQAVWPDTFVSEGILSYSISELRRAFGDDARNPRFIQTIPRRGFRLIPPVTLLDPSLQRQPSIAVLPFADLSPEKDQEYFCDGLAEEIIDNLASIKGMRVAARTSSFVFKGKPEDIRVIGKKLGVSSVLEGCVRKSDSRLRVTAQLISVEDGCHLWSERYDREVKDVFLIQDEISRSIAKALEVTLSPRESEAIARIPTKDLRAYDYYLRGRQFFYQYKRRGVEFALLMFSKAIELDPAYACAYAGVADCCSFLFMYAGGLDSQRERADSASRRAVELNPESAEAHASRGVALALKAAYVEAEAELALSIKQNPHLYEAYYFYARTAFIQGKLAQAIELYERASEVNPQDYQAPLLVAQSYSDLGMEDKAKAARLRGIRIAEARLKLNPDDSRALYMGANGLVALGDYEKGLDWANQALALEPDEPMVLYNVACIQALAGLVEEAVDCLGRAVRNGLLQKEWLEHDSNLDPVRKHPRYPALLELFKAKSSSNSPGKPAGLPEVTD